MILLSMPIAKNQRLENNIEWKTTKKKNLNLVDIMY